MFAYSKSIPETFDAAGYEALKYTEIRKVVSFNIETPRRILTIKAPDFCVDGESYSVEMRTNSGQRLHVVASPVNGFVTINLDDFRPVSGDQHEEKEG